MIRPTSSIFIFLTLLASHCIAAEKIADPTMPANYKQAISNNSSQQELSATPYEWVLNSTLISPEYKLAIINGKHLKVGETINGAIVKRISYQQVILSYQKKDITLSLQQSFISQIKGSSH